MPVLVVGRWPDAARRRTGFPELRTEATVQALQQAGLEVRVAGLGPAGQALAPGAAPVVEEGPGWLEAITRAGLDCEVVVAAGPHNASRAAVLVAGERPVWADVPGDPFAEVQAVALAEGAPRPARQAAAAAALLPALTRADGFGAVSPAQRLLLLGQLGLVGRLAAPEAADPVAVVPVAWHLGLPTAPPRRRPAGQPLTVLLAGAFNAWLDVDGLVDGLDRALGHSVARVVVTGGAAAGHHDAGWERFSAWAARHADRVERLGFLPAEALPAVARGADVGISLDAPGLEPETGSRTRVLLYLSQGLQVVASDRTALCSDLAARGWLLPAAGGEGLARGLEQLHRAGSDGSAVAAAQAALARELAPARAHAPVVAFARRPWRLPAVDHPMADLAAAHAALLDERSRLHATPTWRALSTLHGLVRRRRS